MGMNDENEIIELSCSNCGESIEGTFKDLFGDIPNLALVPKISCRKCAGTIELSMTGRYQITKPTKGFETNMAYPQYKDDYGSHHIISIDGWAQLQAYVLELKNEPFCGANPKVKKHWDDILAGIIPFGMQIAKELRIVKGEQNEEKA